MFLKRKQLKSNFHVPFRGDVSFQRGTSQDVFSPNDLYGQRKMSRLFVGLCALVRWSAKEKAITWDTFIALVAPELVVAKALLNHCNSALTFDGLGSLGEEKKEPFVEGWYAKKHQDSHKYDFIYYLFKLFFFIMLVYVFIYSIYIASQRGRQAEIWSNHLQAPGSYEMWPSATRSLAKFTPSYKSIAPKEMEAHWKKKKS